METTNEYDKQANDFLKKTGTTFKAEFLRHGRHWEQDKDTRDIYKLTLTRGSRSRSFEFGQSLNKSGFYYKKGVNTYPIDRKYLNNPNLPYLVKKLDYSFMQGVDTIHKPEEPRPYDLLACLQKYDVGTFENFCSEFGYDSDSKRAERTYEGVREEYEKVCALFNEEELTELQEIQ